MRYDPGMPSTVNPYEPPRDSAGEQHARWHWSQRAVVVLLLLLAVPASLAAAAIVAIVVFLVGYSPMWALVGLCVGSLMFTWSLTRFAKVIRLILQNQ